MLSPEVLLNSRLLPLVLAGELPVSTSLTYPSTWQAWHCLHPPCEAEIACPLALFVLCPPNSSFDLCYLENSKFLERNPNHGIAENCQKLEEG